MSKPLAITQKQVRALCEGAKKAGYAPIVKLGNAVVVLVPEDRAIHGVTASPLDASNDQILDAELAAFEAKHGDG